MEEALKAALKLRRATHDMSTMFNNLMVPREAVAAFDAEMARLKREAGDGDE